tara:strand:+ start:3896 stop:4408 length:513 start_codon:yes stop_codon:yes gene_type:complete
MAKAYKHQTTRYVADRNADWRSKKAQGEMFEARVRNWLKEQGHECWKPKETHYDLRINIEVPLYGALPLTGECKYDVSAASTHNLALQVFDGGQPSGIHPEGPNPHLWFHGVGEEMWIIRTKILQSVVETYSQSWGGKIVPMGNTSEQAKGILMPITAAKKAIGGQWVTL